MTYCHTEKSCRDHPKSGEGAEGGGYVKLQANGR